MCIYVKPIKPPLEYFESNFSAEHYNNNNGITRISKRNNPIYLTADGL